MSLTERHTLLHQVVGKIRCIGEILCHGTPHNVLANLHATKDAGINSQAELDSVDGIKDAFLVLLQIFIISKRQSLYGGQHSHKMAHNTASLATHQLRYIRIFLLRHHRRTSAVGIVQLHEEELTGAPKNGFLAEARQVHHQDGGSRQELHDVVPVRYCIQAVAVNSIKIQLLCHIWPVNREGSTSQSTGSQRHDIATLIYSTEAVKIPLQHGEIGHHVMGKQDRLCPLEMGIARHDDIAVFPCRLH